jgi:hypothetical protein
MITYNAHAFGGNVTILPNARVLDTASLFQRGYANAFGGNIVLKAGARVDGDAYSFGGKIIQEPGSIVGGEKATFNDRHGMMYGRHGGQGFFQYGSVSAPSPRRRLWLRLPSPKLGRGVGGEGKINDFALTEPYWGFFAWYFFNAMFRISAAVVAAILGLVIIQTSPQFLPKLAVKLEQLPGLAALWGMGAIMSIVFISVFLAITLIGIPLIPLVSLTAIVASFVGALGVALFVGKRFNGNENRSISQQFLVGLAILTALALIPFLGGVVVFLINLFGLGILLLCQFNREKPQLV